LLSKYKIDYNRINRFKPCSLTIKEFIMDIDLKGLRVLIMTAVSTERDAILRGLRGESSFDVVIAGVGPALAAARTASALAVSEYGLVISAGIGGGFNDRAEIGSLVVANEIVAADLGVETTDGFLSIDELGFGSARIPVNTRLALEVTKALRAAGLSAHMGPILTVSTATGTMETTLKRSSQVLGATAEGMEGFGVATAAQDRGIPILEIRAISNRVGPRDREAWRIKEALEALEAASSILQEVFS
jgi:futalosine hydrolase